jgi:hypothetical protein
VAGQSDALPAATAGYLPERLRGGSTVKGSEAGTERPGFKNMLDRIAGNGVRAIIVVSPDCFARDLAVQLAGHDYLRNLGVALIPATAPDFFTATQASPDSGPDPRTFGGRIWATSRLIALQKVWEPEARHTAPTSIGCTPGGRR